MSAARGARTVESASWPSLLQLSCLPDLSRRLTERAASITGPHAAPNWSFCTRLSM